MTLGEKLKEMRHRFGMTQEKLAERLCVSRQAVTKWESDQGIPDTGNLKVIAETFGVTIDYLLNEQSEMPLLALKETIKTDDYDKKRYRNKYEAALLTGFEGYEIYPLMREKKMNVAERVFDFLIGSGTVQLADALGDMSPYYLVKKDKIHLLVNIRKNVMTAQELAPSTDENQFEIDHNRYIRMNALIQ